MMKNIEYNNGKNKNKSIGTIGSIKYLIAIALVTTFCGCATPNYQDPNYRSSSQQEIDPEKEAFMKLYYMYINNSGDGIKDNQIENNILSIIQEMYRGKQNGIKYFLLNEASIFEQNSQSEKASKCLKLNTIIDKELTIQEAERKIQQKLENIQEQENQRLIVAQENQELGNYNIYLGISEAKYGSYKWDGKIKKSGRTYILHFYKKEGFVKLEREAKIKLKYNEYQDRLEITRDGHDKSKEYDLSPSKTRKHILIDFGKLEIKIKFKDKNRFHRNTRY